MTAFRVHGHDDIFLIHTGQGYKGVCLGDSFLFQKLVIGGIAMDIAGKVIEREISEEDHKKLIDEFIENVGEAS